MADYAGRRSRDDGPGHAATGSHAGTPGKQTLVEQAYAEVVQRRAEAEAAGEPGSAAVHAAAERGVAAPSTALPFADAIQRSFGRHDISAVQAHAGGEATASARAMNAQAYAVGNHVVLGDAADLHTVAHEAAHVVQQRAGVQLKGGVGDAGDSYERHADEVADAVVAGRSANHLLSATPGGGGGGGVQAMAVQRKWTSVRRSNNVYWDGPRPYDPSQDPPPPQGRTVIPNPHAPIDPRAGEPARPGGGGFALPDGYSSNATFQSPTGPVATGMPSAAMPGTTETVDYGFVAVHHQGVTPQTQPVAGPSRPRPTPASVNPLAGTSTSSFVSQDVMDQFAGRRDDTQAFPPQGQVMGNMSAQQAMMNAGQPVLDTQYDWLHRHRFAHGGIDHQQPQTQDNLVTGTHGANIRHLTLENSVSHGTSMTGVVPTSTALHNPISQGNHAYGSMEYGVHSPYDPNIALTSNIDLNNPQMPHRGDQPYVNQAVDRHMSWATTHQMILQGVLTVNDLGPQGAAQYAAWKQSQGIP